MHSFSDTLSRLMEQKNLTVYQLSKLTGIERTSLHRIAKGTRPAHKEMLSKLANALRLTPDETEELQRSFAISEIGETVFYRREAVHDLLCAFQEPPEQANYQVELNASVGALSPTATGQFQVQQLMKIILDAETTAISGFIKSNSLPSHSFLMSTIQSVAHIAPQLDIRHVICFENKNGESNDTLNINTFQQTVALLLSCENYIPSYYYGSVADRFDSLAPFSNVLLTSRYALLFSEDERFGILIEDRERVEAISEWFAGMENRAANFVHKFASPLEHLVHYKKIDSSMFSQDWTQPKDLIYSISPHPCVTPFLTEEICEAHLEEMPGRDQVMRLLAEHLETYQHVMEKYTFVHYFTQAGVDTLMRGGRWLEIPADYYTPIAPRYRLQLLRALCDECAKGMFQMRLYNDASLRLPQNFCVYMDEDVISFIYVHSKRGYLSFSVSEPFFVHSIRDYMASLSEHSGVWSQKDTLEYLNEQLKKYEAEFEEGWL